MKKVYNWIKVVFITFFLIVSLFLLLFFIIIRVKSELDSEYPVLSVSDEVSLETYYIEKCNRLSFFSSTPAYGNKKTQFINVIPNIKIVNDNEYYVELNTNKSIHNAMSIVVEEEMLYIDILDEYYERVYEDDPSYDYDFGLYVDCSTFEIIIHAPIHTFLTDTQVILDFDAAKTDNMTLSFSFDGAQANIYNIDANDFNMSCAGSSRISLSGTVTNMSNISTYHDTRVDATKLDTKQRENFISNYPFGISYVQYHNWIYLDLIGIAFSIGLVAFPVIWIVMDIKCIRKCFEKTKK